MKRQMKLSMLMIGAGSLLAIAAPSIGQSQGRNCAPRTQVLAQLSERYGEVRQSVGVGTNNTLIETFASDNTGSWTITATNPQGVTCLIATGQSYEVLADIPKPQGSKL